MSKILLIKPRFFNDYRFQKSILDLFDLKLLA